MVLTSRGRSSRDLVESGFRVGAVLIIGGGGCDGCDSDRGEDGRESSGIVFVEDDSPSCS
jgi:hypothetical protein